MKKRVVRKQVSRLYGIVDKLGLEEFVPYSWEYEENMWIGGGEVVTTNRPKKRLSSNDLRVLAGDYCKGLKCEQYLLNAARTGKHYFVIEQQDGQCFPRKTL